MNENQKVILEKILKLPVGTVLRRGKSERILIGFMPGMVSYKTNRSKTKITVLNVLDFIKWAEKSDIDDYN